MVAVLLLTPLLILWQAYPSLSETAWFSELQETLSGEVDEVDPEEESAPEIPPGYVKVAAGMQLVGSPAVEEGHIDNERLRQVTISRAFLLSRTPVTQRDWMDVMDENPSNFSSCGFNCPVEQVSWYDAVDYLNELSEREELEPCYEESGESIRFMGLDCEGYRLPTETEWEYALRAGSIEPRYGELDEIAWYRGNAEGQTQPVWQKESNRLGIFDMIGNVSEWTNDWYGTIPAGSATDPEGPEEGSQRVIRGCSWSDAADLCRAAYRHRGAPDTRDSSVGFRVARTIP